MIILAGMGIHDIKDLPLKVLEQAQSCEKIYAEFYTNLYHSTLDELSNELGKPVTQLKRSALEENLQKLVTEGTQKNILILVPGDPLTATTHIELLLETKKQGVELKIIHASSIYSAVAQTGLQIYKFGKTTTIASPEQGYNPTTPYRVIAENKKHGMHTLVLLDVKEESGHYMTQKEGLKQLLLMESKYRTGAVEPSTQVVSAARLGGDDQKIIYTQAQKLKDTDLGPPPHVIIVPAQLHFKEEEVLNLYKP